MTASSRRDFLIGVAGITIAAQPGRTAPRFMYVGSYTSEGRGRGDGISVYQRQQPTRGTNGVHLAIDGTNRFLALANYATGTLAVLPINPDGSLAPVSDLATMTGTLGPHRTQQESSHPHQCPFDPSGRFIAVPDKGLDRIFVYRLDPSNGTLAAADPPSVAARAGAAPRHLDFHPTKPFAYVINEIDSTITTYAFDPATGALKPLQILPSVPPTWRNKASFACRY